MKLVNYQRPSLSWPTFGRLFNLNEEVDRLFESPLQAWSPALDVREDKDKFTVNLEVPGIDRKDIHVTIEDNCLVITGERKSEAPEAGTEVHRQERFYGKFSRALTLPVAVDADKIKAAYKDGVLSVSLPKAETAKPKHIDVSVN